MVHSDTNGQTAVIDSRRIGAVVVDVEGVVVDVTRLHAEAWKSVFDAFLRARAERLRTDGTGAGYRPFDVRQDYLRHLSGRPREEGIRSFLASREITVAGDEANASGRLTIRRLGQLKDRYLFAQLRHRRVFAYPSTTYFLRRLREHRIRTVAVSSGDIGIAAVRAAGVGDLFDRQIAGPDAAGWWAPSHLFRAAVRRLDVPTDAAATISAAPARLEAARHAGFGLVVGVDRSGQAAAALRQQGAHVAVTSLADVRVGTRNPTFAGREGIQGGQS